MTSNQRVLETRNLNFSWLLILGTLSVLTCSTVTSFADENEFDFFESKIRPVLAEHCYGCHSSKASASDKLRGGLKLDSRAAAFQGGESGLAIVPGKSEESLLLSGLRYESLEMPPKGKLNSAVIDDFAKWIKDGAAWPPDNFKTGEQVSNAQDYDALRRKHWAWRPVKRSTVSTDSSANWSLGQIDRFVSAKLQSADLTPSPTASPATRYRRLHFDLLGLPPTFEDLQTFCSDTSPGAYERAVDRLLASPAYGERWARIWLDVARYADNGGFNSQTKELYTNFPYAYTYRDYVVRAFNEDLPYDRFITEQLAADHLDLGDDNRALAALGFLTLGDKSFGVSQEDQIDDCIDTVTRGLMGITVSCARCHDHKYDPIPTADYYSLFGIFRNSEIRIAARLHTFEKSTVLPAIFASKQERDSFVANEESVASDLRQAQSRFFEDATRHIGERLADYLLRVYDAASDDVANGLNPELVKLWKEFTASNQATFRPLAEVAKLGSTANEEQILKRIAGLASVNKKDDSADCNPWLLDRLRQSNPASVRDVADFYAGLLREFDKHKDCKSSAADTWTEKDVEAIAKLVADKKLPLNLSQDKALALPIHDGKNELDGLQDRLNAIRYGQPRAVAARDRNNISDSHVLIRGNPRKRGKVVPRRFLALLSTTERKNFDNGSGRLELARAISSPENPLTARVISNRLWMHHFGRGIVESVGDFGTRSNAPSHPELLDYLASRLIESDWSLKNIQREIVLSQTYRQTSIERDAALRIDPENRLLWKMPRRRLGFEAVRDTLLKVSGELDARIGGEADDTWSSRRRTIYGYVNRYRIAEGYMTFDFPNPSRISPKRTRTLIPQQALFLMNAPFVQERVKQVVKQLEDEQPSDPTGKSVDGSNQGDHSNQEGGLELKGARHIRRLYQIVLSRSPTDQEIKLANELIRHVGEDGDSNEARNKRWQNLAHALILTNEFMYVD